MKLLMKNINNNCVNCEHHKVEQDPDKNDWFCRDDVKVKCTLANKNITVGCRPYNIRNESKIPKWCPLINKLDITGDKNADGQ